MFEDTPAVSRNGEDIRRIHKRGKRTLYSCWKFYETKEQTKKMDYLRQSYQYPKLIRIFNEECSFFES